MAEGRITTRDGTWTFDLQADGTAKLLSFEKAEPRPMRGLGDAIAAATTAVGIRPCAGCQKRKEALNRLVPFAGQDATQTGSEAPGSPEAPPTPPASA